MKKRPLIVLAAVLVVAAGLAGWALGLRHHNPPETCSDLTPLLKDIMKNKRLGFLSTAIDSTGKVYMFLINNRTNNWIMLHITPGARKGCVVMEGTGWQFLLKENIEKAVPDMPKVRR